MPLEFDCRGGWKSKHMISQEEMVGIQASLSYILVDADMAIFSSDMASPSPFAPNSVSVR